MSMFSRSLRQIIVGWLALIMLLSACSGQETSGGEPPQGSDSEATQVIQATPTERPTVTPAITATAIPTPVEPTPIIPTPLPADQRDYELCVSIASDSNGYGHVTFQAPDTEEVAISYITPLAVPLQAHLDALGLDYLDVVDRSLSAGGVTIESSNYLESDQFYNIQRDKCKFVIITPFYPDVAVNLSSPEDYITNLNWLLQGVTSFSPTSHILLLNFYQTDRAPFTADNAGRGLNKERIDAFNAEIEKECAPDGVIGSYEQVNCVDIRPFFEGMGTTYILGITSRQAYEAIVYRTSRYDYVIEGYYERKPEGVLVGDGIHLSLDGRDRLTERLAEIIFDMNDEF